MPRAKASLLVILTTVLAVAILFLLPYTPARVVHTAVANRGELVRSMLLSGVVSYANQQPCISLAAGRVARVHVSPGQAVQKGDLLFSLDTSAQEQALAALQSAAYRQQSALEQSGQAMAALAAAQTLEWRKTELELRQIIESAQIRAAMDGTVEAVYTQPGDSVNAASLLGSVRDDERCVVAAINSAALRGIGTDAPAVLERQGTPLGAAKLEKMNMPLAQDGLTQQVAFAPISQEQLAECAIGDTVTVRLLQETVEEQVLIPLSAVDVSGRVWYVDNGQARAETVDASRRSESFVAVTAAWEGRHVILSPEGLYEGCPVKEAELK